MIRSGIRSGALLLCLCLCGLALGAARGAALEKSIELGKAQGWNDVQSFDGVTRVDGRWGYKDLALSSGEYSPDSVTELLMHFDRGAPGDTGGAYRVMSAAPRLSTSVFALGDASALFNGQGGGISLEAPPESLFAKGAVWDDATIEFWLYPASLSNGETVLSWTGSSRQGEEGSARLSPQSIHCVIRDRKLVWDFQGVFTLPTGERLPVTLNGTRQLLPRVWHHHLLRYSSHDGLLEYLIDGVPEAIVHVTDTGRESGSIAVPRIGLEDAGPLVIGPDFTGFLDELRVSRRFVEDPGLSRFPPKTGTVTSRILDLGFTATRILRIESVYTTPGDSGVEFYYQTADSWTHKRILKTDTDWVSFTPAANLADTVRGRYVQVMMILYPDGTRNLSPRVSSLRIVYEPNEPPAPPAGLMALPGNGKVTLTWRPVNELNVKGYAVYYGTSPHNYLGTGASNGDSPIDAGSATSIEITGLENGSLYYFAVVAYDSSDPPQRSPFSAEVSARPSRIYP